jgi:VIT1/CCC1 family predicted Fe2+/Mn2+ transporter
MVVQASAQKESSPVAAQLTAGLAAAAASNMLMPLAAAAEVTPSLRNFIYSLVAGGAVLGGIALAITAVSNFDPVRRG